MLSKKELHIVKPDLKGMIKIEDCKDNYLYRIDARNARYGIYSKEHLGFFISRTKFSSNYLFVEYHYDVGKIRPEDECFGTAIPLEEIRCAPENMRNDERLQYLNELKF